MSVLPVKPNPLDIKWLTSSPRTPPGNCGNCACSEYSRKDSNALLDAIRMKKPVQATAMERRSLSVATSMRRYPQTTAPTRNSTHHQAESPKT